MADPLAGAETFDADTTIDASRRPSLTRVTPLLTGTNPLDASGAGFRPGIEASGGGTRESATNYPVVEVMRPDNEEVTWLFVDPSTAFDDVSFGSVADAFGEFPNGPLFVTVFVNGVPSRSAVTLLAPGDPIFADGLDD